MNPYPEHPILYQKGTAAMTLSTLIGHDWQSRTSLLTLTGVVLLALYVIGIRVVG